MNTLTTDQAARIAARTAQIVADLRAEADALEAAGDASDVLRNGGQYDYSTRRRDAVAALRDLANSRERAGGRAVPGARIGRA